MDITVEDGTGIVIANSYISVEEADDLLSINIHASWSPLTTENKEALLMYASSILDERTRWNGRKLHSTSGLAWPRVGVRDKEGFCVDDTVVPAAVKYATAVLANHLVLNNPEVANTSANLTELQADVVRLKFNSNVTPEKYPSQIKYILQGLGTVSMGRGGPKRIVKC